MIIVSNNIRMEMSSTIKRMIIFALMTLPAGVLFAQEKLDSGVFVNTSKYKPTVAEANKISENPIIVDSTKKFP